MKPAGISSIWRDASGVTAPVVAVLAGVLISAAALVIDVGTWYVGSRNLQAATEAAALAAAIDPYNATTRAQSYLVKNGYPASVIQSVVVGRYCADNTLAGSARFFANSTGACPGVNATNGLVNAVKVTTSQASRQYFSRILGANSPIPTLTATATAARIDEAGLAMTTGVLGVDLGLVNTLLTALSGRNIALTSAQYQALLSSNIDAARFFDALAQRVGETGTYSALVSRTVTMGDILAAGQTALDGTSSSATVSALQTLATQLGGTMSVPLSGLFDLGVWEKMPVGGAREQPNLKAGLNVYQLIAYGLQTGNPSGLNITLSQSNGNAMPVGIAQIKLVGIALGQVARARFGFGPPGETAVNTSALRIQLIVKIANVSNLLGGILNVLNLGFLTSNLAGGADIPVLIDVGSGSAQVTSISCNQEAATDSRVGILANSGLLTAYVGNVVPANPLAQPMQPITRVDQADLINLSGLSVKVAATAGPITGASRTLDFRQVAGGDGTIGSPPLSGQSARVDNNTRLGDLVTTIVKNLQINACVNILLLGQVCASTPNGGVATTGGLSAITLITNVLSAITQPILALGAKTASGADPLLDDVFKALGIQPGYADVWVTGARCGVPVLV